MLLGLGRVLLQEGEESLSNVLVQSVVELSDDGGDSQTLVENTLLALNLDVLRPANEASEVALGLDVSTNTEVSGLGDTTDLDSLRGSSFNGSLGLRHEGTREEIEKQEEQRTKR